MRFKAKFRRFNLLRNNPDKPFIRVIALNVLVVRKPPSDSHKAQPHRDDEDDKGEAPALRIRQGCARAL
ncbi:hypothetical protein D3C83_132620 [compost metagenome]